MDIESLLSMYEGRSASQKFIEEFDNEFPDEYEYDMSDDLYGKNSGKSFILYIDVDVRGNLYDMRCEKYADDSYCHWRPSTDELSPTSSEIHDVRVLLDEWFPLKGGEYLDAIIDNAIACQSSYDGIVITRNSKLSVIFKTGTKQTLSIKKSVLKMVLDLACTDLGVLEDVDYLKKSVESYLRISDDYRLIWIIFKSIDPTRYPCFAWAISYSRYDDLLNVILKYDDAALNQYRDTALTPYLSFSGSTDSALKTAIECNNIHAFDQLIEWGVNPNGENFPDSDDTSTLRYAIELNHYEIANRILNSPQFDIDLQESPVGLLIQRQDYPMLINVLKKYQIKVSEWSGNWPEALELSQIAELLKYEVKFPDDFTRYLLSVRNNDIICALSKRASNDPDWGMILLRIVIENKDIELFRKVMPQKIPIINTDFYRTCRVAGNEWILELDKRDFILQADSGELLKEVFDPYPIDQNELQFMIRSGLDIRGTVDGELTPLLYVCDALRKGKKTDISTAIILLRNGADIRDSIKYYGGGFYVQRSFVLCALLEESATIDQYKEIVDITYEQGYLQFKCWFGRTFRQTVEQVLDYYPEKSENHKEKLVKLLDYIDSVLTQCVPLTAEKLQQASLKVIKAPIVIKKPY